MVDQLHQHPPATGLVVGGEQGNQWRARNIQVMPAWMEPFLKLLADISSRTVKIDFLNHCTRLAQHHLHGLGQAVPEKGGAQDVVARYGLIERGDIRVEPRALCKT